MDEPLFRFDRPLMGGILTISLHGKDRHGCRTVADSAFREVERLERMLTLFDPESALCRLNRDAGERPVPTEPEIVELIEESLRFSCLTRGAFDITVNPLMRIWGFRGGGKRPTTEEIAGALRNVGYEKIACDSDHGTIAFLQKGIEIDFGGIGKGYAVDRALQVLRSCRIDRALVSFGSVTFALGSPLGKSGWAVAVQDPRDPSRSLGTMRLRDRAIASSGDTHQCHRFGEEIVPHVIDPRNGYPAGEIRGTTVVHPSATVADALSTGLMVLGKEEGDRLLSSVPGLEGILTRSGDGRSAGSIVSKGWETLLEPSAGSGMTRRRFVRTALLALGSILVMTRSATASIDSRAMKTIRALYPDAVSIRNSEIRLGDEQMRAAQEATGKRFRKDMYEFYEILGDEGPIGFGVILDVMGKERPITFLVVADPGGMVDGVEVLAYREAIGGEIRASWFLDQFRRKGLDSPLSAGDDIRVISGATISSRAAGYAVRKGLALVAAVYGLERRSAGE